jgi:hypothetical protein
MIHLDVISNFLAGYLREPPTPVELDRREIRDRRNDLQLTPVKPGELAHPLFYEHPVVGPNIVGIETREYKYLHSALQHWRS